MNMVSLKELFLSLFYCHLKMLCKGFYINKTEMKNLDVLESFGGIQLFSLFGKLTVFSSISCDEHRLTDSLCAVVSSLSGYCHCEGGRIGLV